MACASLKLARYGGHVCVCFPLFSAGMCTHGGSPWLVRDGLCLPYVSSLRWSLRFTLSFNLFAASCTSFWDAMLLRRRFVSTVLTQSALYLCNPVGLKPGKLSGRIIVPLSALTTSWFCRRRFRWLPSCFSEDHAGTTSTVDQDPMSMRGNQNREKRSSLRCWNWYRDSISSE